MYKVVYFFLHGGQAVVGAVASYLYLAPAPVPHEARLTLENKAVNSIK